MSEKDFTDMIIAELVKQMIDEAKKESVVEEKNSDPEEDYPGVDGIKSHLEKLSLDAMYESAWTSDEDWLKERLESASKNLYGRSPAGEFPYFELFIIGLYGLVAKIRSDLKEFDFIDIVDKNTDLLIDLY